MLRILPMATALRSFALVRMYVLMPAFLVSSMLSSRSLFMGLVMPIRPTNVMSFSANCSLYVSWRF